MDTARWVKVSILVLSKDDRSVLYTKLTGSSDWSLPGGYVEEGELILERGTQFLAEQTGLQVSLMRALALDQTPANSETREPETLTYVLGAGYAKPNSIRPFGPVRWVGLEEVMRAEGLTKYAVTSALYAGGKALSICLGGEAIYSDADYRMAEKLKQAHRRGEWTPGNPIPEGF
ncbi:NUDIX domain-containing protein [Streptomyces specialis]|uniref:NUDIX domain-containing protein n=1 Tax=Streptomyces specialis TaxID=498367 RepID=UPI00073E5A0C|nr:NUDIX domain-containing protein [Streptomyces specialis]